jgi:DNA repair protein RecO (recombination protein O)
MSGQQTATKAIVLNRHDYGEADRILTLLTPDQGKLSVMARGVRRVKSKLAGGIELFSVSDITFVQGRGSISTLSGSRLNKHYSFISTDLDRTMLGYDLIKLLNKNTEDQPEAEYFGLLKNSFEALDNPEVLPVIIRMWFINQLLKLAGHEPNLQFDNAGKALDASQKYSFDIDNMTFSPAENGKFGSSEIKMLRLAQRQSSAQILAKVQGGEELAVKLTPLVDTMLRTHLRV